MRNIFYKKRLVGILVRTIKKGSLPVTDGVHALQMVTLKHPRDKYLMAHTHAPKKRVTTHLQECLVVRSGKIRIDLYAVPERIKFTTVTLKAGDCFILLDGGYGIRVLEDAEMLEFKNGPFIEDKVLL